MRCYPRRQVPNRESRASVEFSHGFPSERGRSAVAVAEGDQVSLLIMTADIAGGSDMTGQEMYSSMQGSIPTGGHIGNSSGGKDNASDDRGHAM